MQISLFDAEVTKHLSTTEWKLTRVLLHEITGERRRKRGGRRTIFLWFVSLFSESLADVIEQPLTETYFSLEKLRIGGCVEWQWHHESPEKLKARGGNRRMEWRLTRKSA